MNGTDTITIQGEDFTVPVRYAEGHSLTAGEASALNQTYHENLRNNFAKKVKDAKEAGAFNIESMQEALDEYAAQYEFGVRTGGGGGRDPVQALAMNLARKAVRKALKSRNREASPEQITAAAEALIQRDPQYLELAKQQVEEQRRQAEQAMSQVEDILSGIGGGEQAEAA